MNPSFRRALAKGFTLIELLIVVIIIAILAAIAIPQFSNTSSDAQEAALDANLSTMRSAIELYRLQHKNNYPGKVATKGGADCATGSTGSGETGDETSFKEALSMYSNAAGQTCKVNTVGGAYIYGPYLRAVPDEPVTASKTVTIVTDAGNAVPTATPGGGWRFNTTTGQLVMNSKDKARDGRFYYEH